MSDLVKLCLERCPEARICLKVCKITCSNLSILQGGSDFPGSHAPLRERRHFFRYILLAIILIVVAFVGANIWLQWSILESMYSLKAGLDWFSIAFYGGLTFVVGAILALLFINPNPRRSDLFEAFNSLMGLQYRNPYFGNYGQQSQRRIRPMYIRPSKTLWGLWQAIKFVVLFGIFSANNGFPGFGNITIVLDMALRGYGSWSLVPRIVTLPLYPPTGQEVIGLLPSLEIQYQLLVYFFTVVMTVVAIRFFLKLIRDVVIRAGDKWLRDIFLVLSAAMFTVLMNVPYWGMDITIPYEFGAIAFVFFSFIGASVYFHLRSTRETIPLAERRRLGVIVIAAIIVVILVFNVGAITYYRLNWNNNWLQYQWTPLTQKQIQVTRYVAGIQNMTDAPISSLPSGNPSSTVSLIRQWDANASSIQAQNRIGVNYLQLVTPSEIVYEYGQEYWVTPTTFSYPPTSNDWISTHLIYTHSSKIIVMNSHTGEFVNATQAFKLSNLPLMYYGVGFENPVYVHVANEPSEVDNVSYSGQPDYTLCGAQRAVWFLSVGQAGFALSPPQDCIQMLYQQDVFQRVQNVLIGGLHEDGSAYLVTDSSNGGNNLYFAVQVYIDYPVHTGFSGSDYLRFFGVVLVNVGDGAMQGYTVAQNDGFLASFYKQYYSSWGPVPSWLQPQLRYPDQLLGNQNFAGQLDVDFQYHVQDPSIWRSGSDFFVRPPTNDVLYIPFVIGQQTYFTAIQLVEFQGSQGKNLAGFYVVYGGDQLGQMSLYESNSSTISTLPLLGPSAALDAFNADQTTHTALTLTGAVPGNILLYPVNGHLYYFIPAYIFPSSSAGSSSVVTKNPFIDVIDAENASATVRFVNTTSALDQTYGLLNSSQISNPTDRLQYLSNLFTSQGITLASVNPGIATTFSSLVNSTQYTLDSQNSTATQLVNSFITSFVKNTTLTHGDTGFDRVSYWTPSTGTVDYGIVVADPNSTSITQLYYISIVVGRNT